VQSVRKTPGKGREFLRFERRRDDSAESYTLQMSEEAVQTDARLGRALVALQEWKSLTSEEWGAAAGVPTSEAWRLAEELRKLGVEVSRSGEGWKLVGEADLALPEVLEPLIAGTVFAGGVRHFAQIGSTSAAAMRAGVDGAGANSTRGLVWLAEEQTAGKGRAGHVWESNPRDGIYCSALLRPKLSPTDVIIFSLAAGLAVVDAVHEVTGLWGDLRWPNDVLLKGRKFCGILTELNAEVTRVRFVVVGVGMNVNNESFAPELREIATSLRMEAGRKFSRVPLVAALLRALDREQAALQGGVGAARASILQRFEEHSSHCRGAAVVVEEDGGYEGVTRGLDERGFLRVETSAGMRTVLSGGVRTR
jgi:BirA family biotin operon repressor/biotin-[acetyl-CoA-carboxylase] ligase